MILARLEDYYRNIRSRWYWLVLIVLMVAGIFLMMSLVKPNYYIASTTFHPENGAKESTPASSLTALFGGVGQAGGPNSFMIGVLKSRYLSEQVVADTIETETDTFLLADKILEARPHFTSIPTFFRYTFGLNTDIVDYDKKILSSGAEIRRGLTVTVSQDGFIEFNIPAFTKELAEYISRTYIYALDQYYKERKTEKASRNVAFFSFRADSVKTELDKVNRKLARYIDNQKYRIFAEDEIYVTELQSDQSILTQMYVNLVVAREQALAQLQEDTPVIQVLDPPKPPFKFIKSAWTVYMLLGLVGGFIIAIFWLSRKLISEDMRKLINYFIEQSSQPDEEP